MASMATIGDGDSERDVYVPRTRRTTRVMIMDKRRIIINGPD